MYSSLPQIPLHQNQICRLWPLWQCFVSKWTLSCWFFWNESCKSLFPWCQRYHEEKVRLIIHWYKNNYLTQILCPRCQSKQICTFTSSNNLFQDPCRGIYKFVKIEFDCLPRSECWYENYFPVCFANDFISARTICQDQMGELECPPGKVIKVSYALYGRRNNYACKSVENLFCLRSNSE